MLAYLIFLFQVMLTNLHIISLTFRMLFGNLEPDWIMGLHFCFFEVDVQLHHDHGLETPWARKITISKTLGLHMTVLSHAQGMAVPLFGHPVHVNIM
jgi:hypothetical protein